MQIVVAKLLVESVTGPTCYPGENGFSSLVAYVSSSDSKAVDQLTHAAGQGTIVTVRCAALEVEGRVGNLHTIGPGIGEAVSISVVGLRHYKPSPKPSR